MKTIIVTVIGYSRNISDPNYFVVFKTFANKEI
jgi:hypothetical protein